MMSKISVWLPTSELNKIDDLKGDISRSLFVRRAIRKAISEEYAVPSGLKATNQTPRAATAPEAVEATTATTTTKEEEAAVQAV
jgi:metal-responsive CopG/Arc/MetJ family transcriptional regulator